MSINGIIFCTTTSLRILVDVLATLERDRFPLCLLAHPGEGFEIEIITCSIFTTYMYQNSYYHSILAYF